MKHRRSLVVSLLLCLALAGGVVAEDWPSWRGARQNGVSAETGLVSSWSLDGENLVWRRDFIGRSTPVVMEGRVYVNGRVGEGVDRQGVVAALDAGTGEPLWERRFNIYLSTVPYNRVGWASITGDPETGYLYLQAVNGSFFCLDRDGEIVWERSFKEEYGRFEGYGGRTASAVVDEDRVIVNMLNGSWGEQGPPRHRYYAFDKRTGEVVWMSAPGGSVYDRNTQSVPVVAVIGGQRLVIGGNGDGHVYALQSRTGREVWGFELSKRGINVSPVVDGAVVYIAHSEENVDEGTLGRVVAIDGTGTGDVTNSHELWRSNQHRVGFPSPLIHAGRLYVVDNSGNLAALDATSGERLWETSIGTVGKGSPVWADGRIYVTETNGHFVILQAGDAAGEILDRDQITVSGERHAEIYGSPAVAYGRVYFTTEEGIYCLGDKTAPFEVSPGPVPRKTVEGPGSGKVATLLAAPAESTLRPGEAVRLRALAFDAMGRPLGDVEADWEAQGLDVVLAGGALSIPADSTFQAGAVVAHHGELSASGRVRVFPDLPWSEGFDEGKRPWWIGAGRYEVVDLEAEPVLVKPVAQRGLLRSNLMLGPSSLRDYTVQADVMATQKGRRRSDGGVINSGYVLDLMGIHQRLQLRSWTAALRIEKTVEFPWEMNRWYTVKLQVESNEERALVRGKVWPRSEEEPAEWTATVEDPHPVRHGAPGLQGYSPADLYFDNVRVTRNRE